MLVRKIWETQAKYEGPRGEIILATQITTMTGREEDLDKIKELVIDGNFQGLDGMLRYRCKKDETKLVGKEDL